MRTVSQLYRGVVKFQVDVDAVTFQLIDNYQELVSRPLCALGVDGIGEMYDAITKGRKSENSYIL